MTTNERSITRHNLLLDALDHLATRNELADRLAELQDRIAEEGVRFAAIRERIAILDARDDASRSWLSGGNTLIGIVERADLILQAQEEQREADFPTV